MLTVSVSRTVDVAIVPVVRLVLDVCRVDGDTTSTLFGGFVNVLVVREACTSTLRENLGDSGSQGGLAMVNVS